MSHTSTEVCLRVSAAEHKGQNKVCTASVRSLLFSKSALHIYYMYVCMYRVYVCMHACIDVCMYVCRP